MGHEEEPSQSKDTQLTAEVANLSARVEMLEREVARLRAQEPLIEREIMPSPLIFWGATDASVPMADEDAPARIEEEAPEEVSRVSLESRLGSQIFSRVGIVALLIGATWFLKLAMDNHWIGPLGRILVGLAAGAGLILWSERFRRQGFKVFSWSLKAIGSGVLYLSVWAAFQLYHLLPATAALGAMILVTAWNAYMAWAQDSEILAVYALAGGMATPLLLSTGGNHEVFLFTYILAIDLATVLLLRAKPWPRLLLGTFPATVAYFIGWYVGHYSPDQLAVTAIFIALFFCVFAPIPIGWKEPAGDLQARTRPSFRITEIFLPLANALFASLAMYSVLEDARHHAWQPWVMLLLAAIYLGMMRLPQTRIAAAVHLSLGIVFLTIAIPLKASGRWIIVGWLAEALGLLWASAHVETSGDTTSDDASRILRWLGAAALGLGFCGLMMRLVWWGSAVQAAFLNARFATAVFGVAAFAAAAWIALHAVTQSDQAKPGWMYLAGASVIALNLTAIVACVRELDALWKLNPAHPDAGVQKALAISGFLMVYGAALLAIGFWRRTAFIRWQALLLLVFTIAKTFLYDMRNLSQGYRVVSFLGLGALLMAVSFAYQKDWLSLRDSGAAPISNRGETQ